MAGPGRGSLREEQLRTGFDAASGLKVFGFGGAAPVGAGDGGGDSLDLGALYYVNYVTVTGGNDPTVSAAVNAWRNAGYFVYAGQSADWPRGGCGLVALKSPVFWFLNCSLWFRLLH